jgi:uncharacterized protein YlxP (DUF503 family)
MIVVSARVVLRIAHARTLKDKRSVVKSLTDRVANRFRVAVAEVDAHDRPKEAVIGLAAVSGEAAHAEASLQQVLRFIEGSFPVELVDVRLERH